MSPDNGWPESWTGAGTASGGGGGVSGIEGSDLASANDMSVDDAVP